MSFKQDRCSSALHPDLVSHKIKIFSKGNKSLTHVTLLADTSFHSWWVTEKILINYWPGSVELAAISLSRQMSKSLPGVRRFQSDKTLSLCICLLFFFFFFQKFEPIWWKNLSHKQSSSLDVLVRDTAVDFHHTRSSLIELPPLHPPTPHHTQSTNKLVDLYHPESLYP